MKLVPSFLFALFVISVVSQETRGSRTDPVPVTKRVTGIGGIFFNAENPVSMRELYRTHLGIQINEYGSLFEWRNTDEPHGKAYTQWSPFSKNTKYFEPSAKEFMINYRVENLEELVRMLKAEGVQVLDTIATYEYGKFAHIMDPEGNKIEFWEPVDTIFTRLYEGTTTH